MKRKGVLFYTAVFLFALGIVNFLRVWGPGFTTGEEAWFSESVLITHPLGMLAIGYLFWRHRAWFDRWMPVRRPREPDPRESLTMQNPQPSDRE
ncbi:hypothetical protein ALI144C_35555 [Actinosynnema sp. ALI-1.44]|uniref:hypothetical protein n=1 Tax=Actinosynnema sp. ALI-1.44 TaxID=1933779 RepID=UPI00097C4631|nr:hypothetical protein [Actinosynnema sp. ALI-1.44]ONI76027.1 hypothetical protein ALI144C_35555 [Actinosynnema sp. ALI-1.44]